MKYSFAQCEYTCIYIYAHTIAGQPSDFLNLQQTCTGKSVYHDDTYI